MGFFSEFFNGIFGSADPALVTKPIPICPDCNIEMEPFEVDGMLADVCSKCSGIWLTPQFFEMVLNAADEEVENIPDDGEMSMNTFERSISLRTCPNCDAKMNNFVFGYTSGIWIDSCPHGHGTWLDPGELEPVRSFHKKMKLPPSKEDQYKMAAAFCEGASKTMKNLSKVNTEVREEWQRRHTRRYN